MTRITKETYVRTHFPNIDKINPLFDHIEVQRVIDSLVYAGYLSPRRPDQNHVSTKNLILRIQGKYKKNFAK